MAQLVRYEARESDGGRGPVEPTSAKPCTRSTSPRGEVKSKLDERVPVGLVGQPLMAHVVPVG